MQYMKARRRCIFNYFGREDLPNSAGLCYVSILPPVVPYFPPVSRRIPSVNFWSHFNPLSLMSLKLLKRRQFPLGICHRFNSILIYNSIPFNTAITVLPDMCTGPYKPFYLRDVPQLDPICRCLNLNAFCSS